MPPAWVAGNCGPGSIHVFTWAGKCDSPIRTARPVMQRDIAVSDRSDEPKCRRRAELSDALAVTHFRDEKPPSALIFLTTRLWCRLRVGLSALGTRRLHHRPTNTRVASRFRRADPAPKSLHSCVVLAIAVPSVVAAGTLIRATTACRRAIAHVTRRRAACIAGEERSLVGLPGRRSADTSIAARLATAGRRYKSDDHCCRQNPSSRSHGNRS